MWPVVGNHGPHLQLSGGTIFPHELLSTDMILAKASSVLWVNEKS